MSSKKDPARPDEPREEKQGSAATPEPPPGNKAELSDADLDKVAGGFLGNLAKKAGRSIHTVLKIPK